MQKMLSAFAEAGLGDRLLRVLESFFGDDKLIIQLQER